MATKFPVNMRFSLPFDEGVTSIAAKHKFGSGRSVLPDAKRFVAVVKAFSVQRPVALARENMQND